jgi:methylamine dehydrogenase accessory protein MauD
VTALIVANAFAWVAILALAATVLALARQVGVLHERIAPVGALTIDGGPAVGAVAPQFALPDIGSGRTVTIGGAGGRTQLLFFLSTTCPVCKKLLPILRHIAAEERRNTDIVLASDGDAEEHAAFYRRERLAPFPYVLSAELGLTFRIGRLPYAVVIGPTGRISSKGLVNSREQIESLLLAQEMGVGSWQDLLAGAAQVEASERQGDAVA